MSGAQMVMLPVGAIRTDDELQPRQRMDDATFREYAALLSEGVRLPPVLVVAEEGALWLADGYHRLFAHRILELPQIAAEVVRGTRQDALRLSLAANAAHGKQRTTGDYRRGYGIAVRNRLVAATDTDGVMGLLRCSIRTASILTQGAREAAAARLKAAIVAAFDGAETQTALAKRLGVDQATVQRVWAAERERRVAEDIERRAASAQADADLKRYENRQAAETHNGAGADAQIGPDEQPDDAGHEPVSVAEARQEAAPERVDSTESPAALRWHAVLRAMEAVDALPSSAELFADRFRRFDHVLLPAVGRAHRIINELHGRLFP